MSKKQLYLVTTKKNGLKPFGEIAKEMGVSSAWVGQIYRRAMEKIRQMMLDDPALKKDVCRIFGLEEDTKCPPPSSGRTRTKTARGIRTSFVSTQMIQMAG